MHRVPQVEDQVEAGEQRFRRGMEHVDLQRDQEELRAIEDARERIASGRYGDCVDCGRPIPFERLQVQPFALRCVAGPGQVGEDAPGGAALHRVVRPSRRVRKVIE